MVANPVVPLEKEDHKRDAEFKKALHGDAAKLAGGFSTIIGKGGAHNDAQKVAVDEYFKHFDNKKAENETEEDRKVRARRAGCILTASDMC